MQLKTKQKKLKLFLNEPNFLKHYLERSTMSTLSKSDKIKTIFPPRAQLERFSHLQHARMIAQRDIQLDSQVYKIVDQFQQRIKINLKHDQDLEVKIQNTLQRLKMDYVEEQMSENLQELQKLIEDNEYYTTLMLNQKKYVEQMIVMTQIKKALLAQNTILKNENEMLKKQEEQVDLSLKTKKKKI